MRILEKAKRVGSRISREGYRMVASVKYPPLRPSCIVVGAQKGGTTAISYYFSRHPGVSPSKTKEINFFGCASRYARGLRFYHSHFPLQTPENKSKITLDVTPDYLPSAHKSAKRIYAYDPEIKLIALLREPTARAYSAWHHYKGLYNRNPQFFYDWIQMCDRSLSRDSFVTRRKPFGQHFEDDILEELDARAQNQHIEIPILSHGLYAEQLETFLRYFPREQLLITTSEQFRADTAGELKKIEEYIGLEPHSWANEEVQPIKVGGYKQKMSEEANSLLHSFYEEPNSALNSLLGYNPW